MIFRSYRLLLAQSGTLAGVITFVNHTNTLSSH